MEKYKFSVTKLVNNGGCFDLQFRKDTRHERTNAPTYYRWKAQFVVTGPKSEEKNLKKISREIGCGEVGAVGSQARLSVQKLDDIIEVIIPYFRKNCLAGSKKKDFELWAKGVQIMKNNKGKPLADWKKTDLNSLLQIQKSCAKYKSRPRNHKWLDMAKTLANKPNK